MATGVTSYTCDTYVADRWVIMAKGPVEATIAAEVGSHRRQTFGLNAPIEYAL